MDLTLRTNKEIPMGNHLTMSRNNLNPKRDHTIQMHIQLSNLVMIEVLVMKIIK